jgi:hypothetical protein
LPSPYWEWDRRQLLMRRTGLLFVVAVLAGAVGCGGDGGGTSTRAVPTPDHVGLGSPPAELVSACRKLATKDLPRRTSLPLVYCPPAIPRGRLRIEYAGPFGRGDTKTYFINAVSPSLPHPYVRRAREKGKGYPPPGHWLVAAWRPASELRAFLRREGARRLGVEQIERVSATVLLVPPGAAAQDSGHAVVFWQLHGVGYTASVHGHINEGVAKAMARALVSEMARCPTDAASRPGCQLVFPTAAR